MAWAQHEIAITLYQHYTGHETIIVIGYDGIKTLVLQFWYGNVAYQKLWLTVVTMCLLDTL